MRRFLSALLAGLWMPSIFFLVVFCLTDIGHEFRKPDATVALAITLTLALRPVGALVFGLLADRYGRRIPLMANLVLYATIQLFTGLAPTFVSFLIARALFGMVMGGQWGVGASPGHGKSATPPPRLFFGRPAAGIRVRIFAGGGRLLFAL
jgi:SHS family lactate transporter-like MFS transporter